MRKNIVNYTLLSAAVMVLLPWLAVTFVRSDAGMAAALLLFFAIDPLFCAAAGWWAGKQGKFFTLPLIPPALFLAGVWLCFEPGEPAFWRYAAFYLLLGCAAMAAARLTEKWRKSHG